MALELAHQVTGDGPPLVVLHGLFGSGRNWTSIARRLGEAWAVHALDLRNHGESPWSDEVGYEAMADDVLAYLDRNGLERPVVVGHSMGGKAAMALALAYGARLRGLVVVDIAPVSYPPALRSYIEAMRAIDLTAVSRRADADAELKPAVAEAGIRGFLLQNLVQEDGRFAWRINLAALDAGLDEISGFPDAMLRESHDGPTLFLHGAKSDYVLPEHEPAIRRLFPQAKIEAVAGSGHWVHAEKPDAFLDQLTGFLETLPAG